MSGRPPRVPAPREPQAVSGIEVFLQADDNRPVIVGERTNVIGSRKFKELIVAEQFEEAAEIGRAQVKAAPRSSTSAWPIPTATRSEDMDRFMASSPAR